MDRVILCLNSGYHSRKIAFFGLGQRAEEVLAEGAAEEIGSRAGRLWLRDGGKRMLCDYERDFSEPADPLLALFDEIDRLHLPPPDAAGHRLVHGGAHHAAPEPITPAITEALPRVVPFAPLHLPVEVDGIEATAARY